MDLRALRCFWALGKNGSLTGAGIELGISEPAVSKRIRSLEKYLGEKLYQSRGGRVALTAAGQSVLDMAIGLFDRLQEFEKGLANEATTGSLTLAAEDPVHFHVLPGIVEKYNRQFPNVRLRLLSRSVSQTVELVRQNQVDLGIVPRRDFPDGLVFHPWQAFEAYVVIPKTHPLARRGKPDIGTLLDPDVMRRYPLIVGEAQEPVLKEALSGLGLPLNVGLEVSSSEAAKRFAAAGLGVAVVSGISLSAEDEANLIIVEVPASFGARTTYGALMRERKYIDLPLKGLLPLFGIAP